jgi:NADPH:quinone reductase
MKAWQMMHSGAPSKAIRLVEIPVPDPGPGEVRIRVIAAPTSFTDYLHCHGHQGQEKRDPFTLGQELYGVIDALGEASRHVVGSRVVAAPLPPTGSFAEYAVARDTDVFVCDDIPEEAAIGLLRTSQTAYVGLRQRARAKPGEIVAVFAAAQATGLAVIQQSVALGLRIIAITGGDHEAEQMRAAGAEAVIRRQSTDLREQIQAASGGHGIDIFADLIVGAWTRLAVPCMAPGGRLLVGRFAGGIISEQITEQLLEQNLSLLAVNWDEYRVREPDLLQSVHQELLAMVKSGAIPEARQVKYQMDELPQALADLEDGQVTGTPNLRPAGVG